MGDVLFFCSQSASNSGGVYAVSRCNFIHWVAVENIFLRRWVNQRKAFGKPLSSLAVIRSKLAGMISRAESVQSWLENITYQMNNMVFATILHMVVFAAYRSRDLDVSKAIKFACRVRRS